MHSYCICTLGIFSIYALTTIRKGILLHRSSKRIEAMDVLIKSLNAYPWNWSAWLMLGVCIQDIDDVGILFISLIC